MFPADRDEKIISAMLRIALMYILTELYRRIEKNIKILHGKVEKIT